MKNDEMPAQLRAGICAFAVRQHSWESEAHARTAVR